MSLNQTVNAERVLRKLTDYATARKRDVERGLESPQLAGLIVQKYGYGICDAFWEIHNEGLAGSGPTYQDVDRLVESIDPAWKETQKQRWMSVATLDLSKQRSAESP